MATETAGFSTLWYALLGLIKMQPNTGYGLRKIFRETPMARYSSSPGAIYPALQNLESRKLIVAKTELGKTGREKQTYRCTAAGTRKLNAWLREPVTPDLLKQDSDIVLLRFSYLDLLNDLDWSIEFLSQFLNACEKCRNDIEQIRESMAASQPLHGQLALMNGIQVLETHERWARDGLRRLRRKRGSS